MKQQLESFWKLSISQLVEQIAAKEQAIDDAILSFKEEFDRMQEIYDKSALEHASSTVRIKENIKILESIVSSNKIESSKSRN